jgi:hypothetical protein
VPSGNRACHQAQPELDFHYEKSMTRLYGEMGGVEQEQNKVTVSFPAFFPSDMTSVNRTSNPTGATGGSIKGFLIPLFRLAPSTSLRHALMPLARISLRFVFP